MGLLDILRGVADQADFIPGVDPNKNSQGLISQLLGMNKQPLNPSGVPPIMPQNAVQKPSVQAPGGAVPNPFQQFSKPRGPLARMFTPNSYDRQHDAGHQNFLAEQSNRLTAQQAQTASQQKNEQLTAYLTQAGLSPAQIAQVQASNMLNTDETGKNLAENLGPSSLGQGELGNNLFHGQTYNPKTPTPLSPEEIDFKNRGLEIDQQNADTNRYKAENQSPLVQVTNNPTPEQYAESLLHPEQPKGKDTSIVFDENGRILVSPNQQQGTFAADALKFNEMNAKFDLAADELDRAIQFIDGGASAGAASFTKNIPVFGGQTPAGGLENSLKTIKARIGFDELQAMRDASPTGGALGQVSEREIDFLQSLMGSLAQDQDPAILRENLVTIRNFLNGRQDRYERAFDTRYPSIEQSFEQRNDAEQSIDELLDIYGGGS